MEDRVAELVLAISEEVAHPPPPPVPDDFGIERRFSKKRMKDHKDFPSCTICLEPFKSNEKIRTLHTKNCTFHTRCLRKWFQNHNTCPNCNLPCS